MIMIMIMIIIIIIINIIIIIINIINVKYHLPICITRRDLYQALKKRAYHTYNYFFVPEKQMTIETTASFITHQLTHLNLFLLSFLYLPSEILWQ